MSFIAVALGLIVLLWIIGNLKSSRPDGTVVRKLHPYRQLMPYIMPGRNESIVFFDTWVNAEELERYLPLARERFRCDVTHALIAAAFAGLCRNPSLNYFVSGRRLYERKGQWVTFSMKREKQVRTAKIAVVKQQYQPGWTFQDLCEHIQGEIDTERSGKRTWADKEYDLFRLFPRAVMIGAQRLVSILDYYNLLPGGFIRGDGMYSSMFVANLGSIGLGPAYHHLYEWGNCPIFLAAGKVEERAVVENAQVVIRRQLPLRWSFDERIDDGLTARFGIEAVMGVLENPFENLGCLAADGSDRYPLDAVPER